MARAFWRYRLWISLSLSLARFAFAAPGPLPPDWYRLPEDSLPREHFLRSHSMGLGPATESLDDILSADADALAQVDNASHDTGSWTLTAWQLDLSLSASGLISPLGLSGTAAVSVLWRKKPAPPPTTSSPASATPPVANGDFPVGLTLVNDDPPDFAGQLEPLIELAVSSGKVRDEIQMRKNLYARAELFYELAQALNQTLGTRWYASQFSVGLSVSVEGMVQPAIEVGGDFSLGFSWMHIQKKGSSPSRAVVVPLTPLQQQFVQFVGGIADDLDATDFSPIVSNHFYPKSIRLGVGLSLDGDFGVFQVGASAGGQLTFSRAAKVPPPSPVLSMLHLASPLLLIESHPPASHVSYARAHRIAYTTRFRTHGIIDEIVYRLNHFAFRRGLRRAVKMSAFWADRASRISDRPWQISEIRPSFTLGIGADLRLVSLTGSASAQLSFRRTGS